MGASKKKAVSPKNLDAVVDGESYRTALSQLLAYDEKKAIYLFRALNSDYFVQYDKDERIEVLSDIDAEELYNKLPGKRETNLQAAFPRRHGGVGMTTPTRYDEL